MHGRTGDRTGVRGAGALYAALLGACVILSPRPLRADEFSQTAYHSARLFSSGTLVLESRMGDIYIEGWDEPRVEVEAEKVVRARSEKKAASQYDRIRVVVEGSDQEVRVRTVYPPRRPWRPFRGGSKLSVNFRIKMPYDANLTLRCVDGDVRVRGIAGHHHLRVNYGTVEIDLPSVYRLRLLDARAWLGYVQSDLHGEDEAGFARKILFHNSSGDQDINVRVRLGGVFIYGYAP